MQRAVVRLLLGLSLQIGGTRAAGLLYDAELPPPPAGAEPAAWARGLGLSLARGAELSAVAGPLRLAGDERRPRPHPRQTLARFLDALSGDEWAALTAGRVLLLDRASPAAHDILRAGDPAVFATLTEGPSIAPPPGVDRGAWLDQLWLQAYGRPMSAAEERRVTEEDALQQRLLRRYDELEWHAGGQLAIELSAQLLDPAGQPRSDRAPAYTTAEETTGGLFAPWDERSLVATEARQPGEAQVRARAWLAARPPAPVVVTVPADGAYTLGELVGRLPPERGRRVDPEFERLRLVVPAGQYTPALFAAALQHASGLTWRVDPTTPARLVLTVAPAELFVAGPSRRLATDLWAATAGAREAAEEPFAWLLEPGRLEQDATVGWGDLEPVERQRLLERLHVAQVQPDGSLGSAGEPITEQLAVDCQVAFSLAVVWRVRGLVRLDPDEHGQPLFGQLTQVNFRYRAETLRNP